MPFQIPGKGLRWAVGLALVSLVASTASAQVWNKKTELTVHERIEAPGVFLDPGKYVLKLVDSDSNRHIVRIMNERENRVLTTVIAIPNYRLKVTGDTQFAWYERPAGEPPALRAWFYPGDNFGQEFVYPKRQAERIATAVQEPVPSVADEQEPVMIAEAQPEEPAPQQLKQATVKPTEPVQMAQAAEPRPARTAPPVAMPAEEPMQELPKTGGFGALLGLLGALALGAAGGLHAVLRRNRSL
jgi:LPXTG-motif cell wall-anchored protein